MAPPPAAAPPGPYSATLPSRYRQRHSNPFPPPPAVTASSSDSNSSISSPLHSALLAALSSMPVFPTRYFPLTPSSCVPTDRSSVVLTLPLVSVAVVSVASVVPPAPLLPPTLYLGILRTPATPCTPPPCTPPSPSPAAKIARKEKYFGDRTGRGESCWPDACGSNKTIAMVEDGIRRTLLLNRPQQYHPVQFRPALRHLHSLADGPVVEQVQ